ncbi:O-acetylhomoserine aminocarboxypropyltransferase/cysteine synthase family protein [Paucilactobacillus suebicus]|uniref:homocysteine desulfhydrase n=1 Tax=Paucilactobacillus suebicus DSM 5007 = KCTC 3549 TaxID=1423807 RepID=A0A0R1W4H2_9LACO|nr:aminotransferase class I/II-fold pyridoxal phosphate-dependent enzyme [Paucilactobacillus suebicus]KRM10307.1 cysteine synthase [Paucilactobacillus suebicus DSM 5007 = KCTC 3549]
MNVLAKDKFDTLRIHAGYKPEDHQFASSVPIYQTAAFGLSNTEVANEIVQGKHPDRFDYTRDGNPTSHVLEERIAAIEGGIEAVSVGSGMSAISFTIFNVAEGGGRIIAPTNIYGSSLDEFRNFFPKFGINFDFVDDVNDFDKIKSLIQDDTKAIYVESVANPSTEIADIETLAKIAHDAGIPLIVDNTFPTPYLLRPFEFGADVVVYSSTKGINGHGNTLSGLIVDHGKFNWASGKFPQFTEEEFTLGDEESDDHESFYSKFGAAAFIKRIRVKYVRLLGSVLSPIDSYFVLLGLETISERLDKEVASATKIAEFLRDNEHVERVYYSGIEKDNSLVAKYFSKGVGSILSFELKGNEKNIAKLIDNVHVFSYLPNIGDAKSLIVNPSRTTHREIPEEIRTKHALNNQVIRLSIGLEDIDDLIGDLRNGLEKAFD